LSKGSESLPGLHAGDAFQLAKQAGTKLAEGIREAGSKLLPQSEDRGGYEDRSGGGYSRGLRTPYRRNPPAGLDPFGGGGVFGRAGTVVHPVNSQPHHVPSFQSIQDHMVQSNLDKRENLEREKAYQREVFCAF
jgi:hypothetical protein